MLGLALRVACFVISVVLLKLVGNVIVGLEPLLPFLDPVYTHAAEHSLIDLQIRGAAVIGPLGDQLHVWLPSIFVPASQAHWAFVRLVVEPGSPVQARLLASGFAHGSRTRAC